MAFVVQMIGSGGYLQKVEPMPSGWPVAIWTPTFRIAKRFQSRVELLEALGHFAWRGRHRVIEVDDG